MRCLGCGKKLDKKGYLHSECLKELFGVNYLPFIELSLSEVSIKAQEMTGKLSISGVQPKLSMRLNKKSKHLEVIDVGGRYILKPQVNTYPNLPQNENLCMNVALNLEIDVPSHSLIRLKDNTWAYIIKRFDRTDKGKLHQEDFQQILGKEDKYHGSLEEIGRRLREVSDVPGLDIQLFFERVVFFFIIGNGDAHLKNFSVIYNELGHIRLSPAYDILSSKLVIPGEEDFALPINGKKNKITIKDFYIFADYLKIPKRVTDKIMLRFLDNEPLIHDIIRDSQLEEDEKKKLRSIVRERFSRLKKRG